MPGRSGVPRMLLFAVLSAAMAKAAAIGIDQANTNFNPPLLQQVIAFSPIGESFTPTQSTLNFVDIFSDYPGVLEVLIHADTIYGTTLGISLPSVAALHAPVSFTFSSYVPLIPGDVYVIQVLQVSGSSLIGSSGGPNSTYAGGDEILGGTTVTGNDLWFDEGTAPEPSTLALLCGGTLLLLLTPRLRSAR